MEITKELMRNRFDEYNQNYFGKKLKKPAFKIFKSYRVYGLCTQKAIYINPNVEWTEDAFKKTMIHEMIHLLLAQTKEKELFNHGLKFRKIMRRMNKEFGLNITIRGNMKFKEKAGR